MSGDSLLINAEKTSSEPETSPFAVHVRQDKRKKFYNRANNAKISVKEFFDFVKTAYQVNESVEQLIPELLLDQQAGVNWNNLANNKLVNQLMISETAKDKNVTMPIKVETECQTEGKFTEIKRGDEKSQDTDSGKAS